MKRRYVEKVLAMALAVTVATTPVSGIAFAAEESAGTNEVKVEEPAAPAPQTQEAPAEQISASQQEAQASEQQSAESAPAKTDAAPAQTATNAAPAQEQAAAEQEAPKAKQSSYKVKIVLEDVMTTSGPSTVTAVSSVTIKAGASKSYTATTVNGWVKTKSARYEGVTYKYANAMKDSSGRTITALTINADELDGDTTLVLRPVYTEVADMHVVVNFNNILKANGEATSNSVENTLSAGSGWSFTQKKLDNMVTVKSFSHQGVNYKYAGYWVDQDGKEFSSLSIKNDGSAREVVYNVSPVYEKTYPEVLDFRYIDNISTGSGSWKNVDSFSTFTHTFKEPDAKDHYKFVEWKNLKTGETFIKGNKFEYVAQNGLSEETITHINIHAMWQPSVTVEYYNSNGELLNSVEKTDANINAYDYTADTQEMKNGAKFLGWYESTEDGAARVAEGTAYELPAVTADPVDQKVIKLYAKYSVSYKVEHYTENMDGSFSLAEDETVEDVLAGSKVSAEAKSFEGFTFDKDIEGTLTEAKADTGLVLKFYYSRNSYNVSYEYEGDVVPAKADEQLPGTVTYKYGQDVPQADDPQVVGFEFSGWNGEVENMPAEDVVVTGSWEEVPAAAPAGNTDSKDKADNNKASDIADNTVPQAMQTAKAEEQMSSSAPVVIEDEQAPLAATGAWALINLLCAIATAILSLILLIRYFGRKEEEEDETIETKHRLVSRLVSLIPALGAVITFIITENMANPMVLTDQWTRLMAAFLLVQAVVVIIAERDKKEKKEEVNA